MVEVGPLGEQERDAWQELFRGYTEFYRRVMPQESYDRAWREFREDTRMHALGARIDGRLVGITHFLVHPSTSSADVCYLQDLFTSPEARGRGVARALIEAVVDWARARECARVYWHTQETNATARRLYDQVALNKGFIQYQVPLD
ncbi:GNAT family N-acetyltransferase [Crossiella sp. CA-258035]|uniref:GNAT family N-acetyltransferase n=1 Tax=Crossiella sp. CA-258035 TaxID=2981138 RepID=UPI0024BD24AD|nr:GNAT family N-acetyltransferase [Crossiella sp. CA-258035]WHT17488.1 GNAT family N-acetyltransferase [Crossiella sp. CA-258035]